MPLNSPITPLSLVDQAFERLSDAIVVGDIKPGERIREAYLARSLGISRGVLREAMQRLEGRKLVTRTSNIGVHVTSLSRTDLAELLAIRDALEGMSARLAATNMTDGEREELQALLSRHEQTRGVKSGASYFQARGDDFHATVARGSKNQRLIAMLCDELYHQLRLYRYRSSALPGRAKEAFAEHQRVVAAIVAGDGDAAEQAMRLHLANARTAMTFDIEVGDEAVKTDAGKAFKLAS